MAGKSSGDRRKNRKGKGKDGKAAAPARTVHVGVIDYKDVAAFSILAIVLIFMPSGLLGRPEVEKV